MVLFYLKNLLVTNEKDFGKEYKIRNNSH